MSYFFDLSIDTSNQEGDIEEILNLRYEIEDTIEEQEIGEVVDGGIMMDGSGIDIGFVSTEEDPTRQVIEEILGNRELLEKTTIEVRPYDEDEDDIEAEVDDSFEE